MRFKKSLAGVVSAAIVVPMLSMTALAYDEVAISYFTFPDYYFRSYVYNNLDINGDGYLSGDELDATKIDLSNMRCNSLEGIEYFTKLEELYASNCDFTTIDISKLETLKVLDCSCSNLTNLDVSNLKNLEYLICSDNNISELDLSSNVKLIGLDCNINRLTNLDVSMLVDLECLRCWENQIKELDLINNVLLKDLECSYNQLEKLDLSNNPNISILYCSNNKISEINVSGLTELSQFNCSDNNISALDLSKSKELVFFYCNNNNIKSLDVSNCNHLFSFGCKDNQLETLNIQNTKLHSFDCSNNKLTELDISKSGDICSYFLESNGIGYKYCPDETKFIWDRGTCKIKSFPDGVKLGIWDDARVDEDGTSYYYNIRHMDFIVKTQLKWDLSFKLYREDNLVHEGEIATNSYRAVYGIDDDKETDNIYISGGKYTLEIYSDDLLLYTDSVIVTNEVIEVTPTPEPTIEPTANPTLTPSKTPTNAPTVKPTSKPVVVPTVEVTSKPTAKPTVKPTTKPVVTSTPTKAPSVEDFAERLYTTCLGRPAEEAGKNYWASELKGGKPGSEVAEGFFFSQEYIGKKLSDKKFIGTLYETFMGRKPADVEVDYWATEMKSGKTRKDIFDGFVNSPEWADICLTYGIRSGGLAKPTFEKEASPAVKAFAERLYTTCLGRKAEKAGLEWWASELANLRQTGTVAAQGFFFSPEFIGLNTSDEEYVARLYLTFMGREPDIDGYFYWVSELFFGASREEVFDGFSISPEFADLCAEAGIMR